MEICQSGIWIDLLSFQMAQALVAIGHSQFRFGPNDERERHLYANGPDLDVVDDGGGTLLSEKDWHKSLISDPDFLPSIFIKAAN